jgi:ribosome-associated protein
MKKVKKPNSIAKIVSDLMLDKKAYDITIIDVSHLTSLTDYFVICTSDSTPQSKAITNHIKDGLTKYDLKPWHIEGYEHMKWILIDYINIVIHIFDKESREYYNFEQLWADGKMKKIDTKAK